MSLIDALIQKGARLGALYQQNSPDLRTQQQLQLEWLLTKARHTEFGLYYGFQEILQTSDPLKAFREKVPAFDYNELYRKWWHKTHTEDRQDVCWPGHVPYYALSSGTSQSASKFIPVTDDMLRAMRRSSRRLALHLAGCPVRGRHIAHPMLVVGSSSNLQREGQHYYGDLSGIISTRLSKAALLSRYCRPGKEISNLPDWNERIDRIAEEAPNWDIGSAAGNPMWTQMILERILERYRLQHIHEVWPNFNIFVHGGVFFEPYRPAFERMLGQPVHYVDSYMASEGFFAYQKAHDDRALNLLGDSGVFFEFVPFDDENFDENGDLRHANPVSYNLNEVEEGKTYALLLSTCAGAWRYLLGDTIRFTNPHQGAFNITGRTKQFLSVCGEHLSIDNLNAAIMEVDIALQAGVREFCVVGIRYGSGWKHKWYVSMDNASVSPQTFGAAVDQALCRLNDDYAVERKYALQKVEVTIIPNRLFIDWLEYRGKMNGQAKIPRVLKGAQLEDFERFLKD
jgi:hypothetical protein